MRGLAADIGGKTEHHFFIQPRCGGGREVVGENDARLFEARDVHILVVTHEIVDDPGSDIAKVGDALAKIIIRERFERLGKSLGDGVKGPFCGDLVLGNHPRNAFEQGRIVEDEHVCFKDARVLRPHGVRDLLLEIVELLASGEEALLKSFELTGDIRFRDFLPFNTRPLGVEKENLSDADPRSHSDAAKGNFSRGVALSHGFPIAEAR